MSLNTVIWNLHRNLLGTLYTYLMQTEFRLESFSKRNDLQMVYYIKYLFYLYLFYKIFS